MQHWTGNDGKDAVVEKVDVQIKEGSSCGKESCIH
jgi:hypothetical protein